MDGWYKLEYILTIWTWNNVFLLQLIWHSGKKQCMYTFFFFFTLKFWPGYTNWTSPSPLISAEADSPWSFKKSFLLFTVSLHRSKSTSDIVVEPTVLRQIHTEELQKYREQIKQGEDKWQDVSITDMCTAQEH